MRAFLPDQVCGRRHEAPRFSTLRPAVTRLPISAHCTRHTSGKRPPRTLGLRPPVASVKGGAGISWLCEKKTAHELDAELAAMVGVDPANPNRARAAVRYAVMELAEAGHCGYPEPGVIH